MTVPVVFAIAGVVSLLVGVLGGGIKAREVEIPSMPTPARVLSSLGGLILIGVSIWLSSPQSLPVPTPTPLPDPTSTPTETAEPSPTLPAMTATATDSPQPSETPAPAASPTPVPVAGPLFGNIKHNPDNAETEGTYFGVSLRNFVLEGSVYNPYSHSEHPWSFAVGFRWINGVYTVIIIDSDGSWRYGYYDEAGSWNGLTSGKLNNLRLNVGEGNHIRLVAYESDGCLYINNAPVADLDLSGIDQPGDIFLSIGGSETADAVTRYENFVVYRASSLDCP